MRNLFNIRKDINQIKDSGKIIKEKAPLFVSIAKLFFIAIKWIIFLFVIFAIIMLIIDYKEEQERKARLEDRREFCKEKCKNEPLLEKSCYTDCLMLPNLKGIGIPNLKGFGLSSPLKMPSSEIPPSNLIMPSNRF